MDRVGFRSARGYINPGHMCEAGLWPLHDHVRDATRAPMLRVSLSSAFYGPLIYHHKSNKLLYCIILTKNVSFAIYTGIL